MMIKKSFLSISIYFALFYTIVFDQSQAGRLYKSRKHLNETILGNDRFTVHDFVDHNRITKLSHLLKRRKHFFQRYGNNYKLAMDDILFQGIFSGDITPNCTWGVGCVPLPDQALHILKTSPHKYVDDELLSDAENYIYIRDKLFEYASEVFNTTVSLTQYGSFFYFFPKKVKSEVFMNGTEYIFAPHSDLCGFRGYHQPLILDRSQPHNLYRKYTVVLYIDVPPPSAQAGGIFRFFDLPNRYKLPLKRAKQYSKNGYVIVEGGAFADPEATLQDVEPTRGKMLLFPAVSHLHAVTRYTGDTDRYALSMFLTDEQGNYEQLRNIMPKSEMDDPKSIAHEFYRMGHPNDPERPESDSDSVHSSSSSDSGSDSSNDEVVNEITSEETTHSESSSTSKRRRNAQEEEERSSLSKSWSYNYYNPRHVY